ncbi:helix-turn-helix domain-containing protein [bacterium]|nr:helix-turn-helix domain-containing protein [bacterium]MBU1991246.1 helix-turn-helix domain-containing protein [bacterium]
MKLYEIAQKVKELRKEKKLTQQQLSEISNISRVTLGKIERGELGSVSVKTLDVILNALSHELDIKSNSGFGLQTLDTLG